MARAGIITAGRVTTILYVIAIVAIAFFLIPNKPDRVSVVATRYFGANTRLTGKLWLKPPGSLITDRIEMDRLEHDLEGTYLDHPIEADKPIKRDDVSRWPHLKDEEIYPVTLDAEPDWQLLNQGTTVELWIGQKPATPHFAEVQAIVASDEKWVMLLRRRDLAADMLGELTTKPTIRLVQLPHEPASFTAPHP
jgi:hypothetical protein